MNTIGLRLNTTNLAVSQYQGLSYDSLAIISNTLLAANESGMFKFPSTASTDAYFETKHFDFGTQNSKQLRAVYISGYFSGSLIITSVIDGEDAESVSISSESDMTTKTYRVSFSSEHRGRFIGIKIANVNGSDFSVDHISAVVSVTTSRWNTTSVTGRVRKQLQALDINATGT